jgi:sec-independent protein translocase protein TatC
MFGTGELLIIALVAIIVVDPKKLPDLMKGLGKAIGEFKQMSGEFKRTIERETEAADFEKRKAEAHEQLYGKKEGEAAAADAGTPADAQPAEHEPQPEEYPQQPPVERAEPTAEPAAEAGLTPFETTVEAHADPFGETAGTPAAEASGETAVEPAAASPEAAPETPAAAAEAPAEDASALTAETAPETSAAPEAHAVEAAAEAAAPAAEETSPAIAEETAPAVQEETAPPAVAEEAAAPAVSEPAPPPAEGGDAPPPPPPTGDEAVGEGQSGRMSLFGHLQDLRKRLTRSAIAMIVGFLGCYAFAGQMLKILMQPMLNALKQSHFIYTLPTEAFFTEMKVAFVAGIFASSPYIFYQIFQFVAPGLYSHERRWIIPIAFFSALCFTVGALFGYFVVFPFGFEFFASYTSDILVFTPKLDEYLDFVLKLLFAFGIVFELPLFLFFLARLGIISHVGLRKKRKYAVLVAFVLAAALTPPDAISQTMMAVPLCILYEVGIWLAYFFGKKKPPKEEPAQAEAA